MATIGDRYMIAELLRNEGRYPGDPQLAAIFSYVTPEGNLTAAVYYPSPRLLSEVMALFESPCVYNVRVLWTMHGGLLQAGEEWIKNFGRGDHA